MRASAPPYVAQLEQLARQHGLEFYPVEFDIVPPSFMLEISVYGLPIRMPHWSFGVHYIHQLMRQNMGHSHIFEVMFPGNPCRAYMVNTNSEAENTLVTAHVIGHADFARNNALFARFMAMAGGHILEQSAARAHRLQQAVLRHGQRRVEGILDAALALEAHVDINQALHRLPYPTTPMAPPAREPGRFQRRYQELPGERTPTPQAPARPTIPPHPESDLLWFIAQHAPELEDWERDILLAVREEAFYFYPVHACQIMNEGWASYWHARLLREADFLPQALYLQAIKAHSDVVRPFAGQHQLALQVNPYHLGFCMWERIIERDGMAVARRICAEEDDFGFIRNHLDQQLAEELDLFVYEAYQQGETRVLSRDLHAIREAILAPRYNYGAPCIAVERMQDDGGLVLRHDHQRDGRGLDLGQAERVMEYVARIWQRPLVLHTVDFRGMPRTVTGRYASS
jgi:stage V sporulation protein R